MKQGIGAAALRSVLAGALIATLTVGAWAQDATDPVPDPAGEVLVTDSDDPGDGKIIVIDDWIEGGVWTGECDEVCIYTMVDPLPVDETQYDNPDSVCDGCEAEMSGPVRAAGIPGANFRSVGGAGGAVAHAPSIAPAVDICLSHAYYVAWLCDWQGYQRP